MQTAPYLPSKPEQPLINQLGEVGIGFLSDRFTVIIDKPVDSPPLQCSRYTFRVDVTEATPGVTNGLTISEINLPPGDFRVDKLKPATTYSVVIQAQNQFGWSVRSDPIEVQLDLICLFVRSWIGY